MKPLETAAADIFGDRLPLAQQYHDSLATDGSVRGFIGPREVPRLWERHILNCAVLAEAIPAGASVADIGSGAGLPGIPLAIARPDLKITLIEPLLKRSVYLGEVKEALGLSNVTVIRGRAEEKAVREEVAPVDNRYLPCRGSAGTAGRLVPATGEEGRQDDRAEGLLCGRRAPAG
ncbi:16S rRNA (guanine(527)-N(7))-methyltransferase RsmG [Staphylococcus chromogenes]|nr:16S rRNA (guanine(527)-N(7))-methyltransferase RsmG [Staphylococcus chromogenes]